MIYTPDNLSSQSGELKDGVFFPITNIFINQTILQIKEQFVFDFSSIRFTVTQPGESAYEDMVAKYRQEKGIENSELPEGLPSIAYFQSLEGKPEILFFAVNEEHVVPLANSFLKKDGMPFSVSSQPEAMTCLAQYCHKALLHELGHAVYNSVNLEDSGIKEKWDTFVLSNPSIINRVHQLQDTYYQDGIPDENIPGEAFADIMVEVLSLGKIKSRVEIPGIAATLTHAFKSPQTEDIA